MCIHVEFESFVAKAERKWTNLSGNLQNSNLDSIKYHIVCQWLANVTLVTKVAAIRRLPVNSCLFAQHILIAYILTKIDIDI